MDNKRHQSWEHSKRASATKSGPGRYGHQGKPGNRISKPRAVRAYKALMNAWAQSRVPNWSGLSDAHGAFTQVGRNPERLGEVVDARRKWLAGISAQRGF